MILDVGWLVTAAIVVLIAGLALRFLPTRREDEASE
jgi:hypothetical protein